jgi:hypothetical protein
MFSKITGNKALLFVLTALSATLFNAQMLAGNPPAGVGSRQYIDPKIALISSFEGPADMFLLKYWKSNLYVQTWSSKVLHKIDPKNGSILKTYGKKGHGPGEFMKILSVTIDSSGITFLDGTNLTASLYSHEGSLRQSDKMNVNQTLTAGTKLSGDEYLVKALDPGLDSETEEGFKIINVKTNQIRIISAKRREPTKLQGMQRIMEVGGPIINRNSGTIYRFSTGNSLFLAFDTKGNPLYEKHTIDRAESPTMQTKEVAGQKFTVNTGRNINIDVCPEGDFFYILSNAPAPDIREISPGINAIGVIDVYKAKTGEYVYSFKVPQHNDQKSTATSGTPTSFVIADGKLMVITGVYICTYSLTLPKAP